MDQFNRPLSNRLRDAALDRTDAGSEQVDDDFVLDPDGVIDLRELRKNGGRSIAAPAEALATIRGQLGDAAEVSDLYDESEDVPRWRLGLRARHAFGFGSPEARTPTPEPAPTLTPLADVIDLSATDAPSTELDDSDLDEAALDESALDPDAVDTAAVDTDDDAAELDEPVLDETMLDDTDLDEELQQLSAELAAEDADDETDDDADRPEATCPSCEGVGHRDLYDRFSQIEFYSCDSCHAMWQQELG